MVDVVFDAVEHRFGVLLLLEAREYRRDAEIAPVRACLFVEETKTKLKLRHPTAAILMPPYCLYGLLQFRGIGELRVQFGNETRHLLFEWLAIVFGFFGADVATGREDMGVRCDLFGCGREEILACAYKSRPNYWLLALG